ncbi:MAG TPA: class I SAM-dependent methyltransferase [Thermoanaerobaculia bacterium]|nr:class I SAM-dependent methyltransferase [Thermoanaerobaculia bacterium]
MIADREEDRLAFVLAGQRHADHFLTPLADPAGKSVLVVGCGAGTDVLWCLRRGASEVLGIDVLEQGRRALDAAAAELGVDASRAQLVRLPVERVQSLGRRFDLVLANNVFEHVEDLTVAFAACAAVVVPGTGRVAIFSAPLYYSSGGSHLPHGAWDHLVEDPEELRHRLVGGGALPKDHALRRLDLATYLDREITLNRARCRDFLDSIAKSGLVALHFEVLPDPRLNELGDRLVKLGAVDDPPSPFDLAAAGVALELALPRADATPVEPRSTIEARLASEREVHGREVERRHAAEVELNRTMAEAKGLRDLLTRVEASWSFRLGRALTAPVRWLAALLGWSGVG